MALHHILFMAKKPEFVLRRLVLNDGREIRVYDNRIHAGQGVDPGDIEYTQTDALQLLHADGVESFTTEVVGDCMVDAGITEGDMVVLDMRVEPSNGCIVAAYVDGVPMLRYFYRDERQSDVVWLVPANSRKGYKPTRVDGSMEMRVLGVVMTAVKQLWRREFGIVSKLRSQVDCSRMKRLTRPVSAKAVPQFAACVVDPDRRSVVLRRLHSLTDGKRGKEVAMVMRAAMAAGVITRPSYGDVAAEFGDIGNRAGYNRYMNYQFFDDELSPLIAFINA